MAFWQQLLLNLIPAGILLFGGFWALKHQERVRRDEDLSAGLRRLRVDALVAALDALGRYHNLKDRRLLGEASPPGDEIEIAKLRAREQMAFEELIDLIAAKQFLLGALATDISDCGQAVGKANANAEANAAVNNLHWTLERWIPPLRPMA